MRRFREYVGMYRAIYWHRGDNNCLCFGVEDLGRRL